MQFYPKMQFYPEKSKKWNKHRELYERLPVGNKTKRVTVAVETGGDPP
jgi:hypothetical protein